MQFVGAIGSVQPPFVSNKLDLWPYGMALSRTNAWVAGFARRRYIFGFHCNFPVTTLVISLGCSFFDFLYKSGYKQSIKEIQFGERGKNACYGMPGSWR